MCGIFGGFWNANAAEIERKSQIALEKLRNRGPDDHGYESHSLSNGLLGLGHTRLSIIDLSSAGHQPMTSACGRYSVVFNGEIYNYKEVREELKKTHRVSFNSQSDTEVLLNAWATWGRDCVHKFIGMFAFVVYDSDQKTLTCVRDAFGIKPLMYHLEDGEFSFASELQPLLQFVRSPALNTQRCYDYLVHGDYDSNENTFVRDVKHLLPGGMLVFDLASRTTKTCFQWWKPKNTEVVNLSFADAADAVREQFLSDVKLHLRSDVPLGTALSGGIDSSAIVCATRHLEPDMPINTFSYIASESSLSEEKWVDITNMHVGAIPHKVRVGASKLISELDEVIASQCEPFGSTSIYAQYHVCRMAQQAGVKVTLDGQGADELLAGYTGYPGQRIRSLIDNGQLLAASRFARNWSRWPGRKYTHAWMLYARATLPDKIHAMARSIYGRDGSPDWLEFAELECDDVELRELRHNVSSAGKGRRVAERLSEALQNDGLQELLRHGDRNSMRFSVESRVPFLTTNMADLLLSLPEHFLISDTGETKSVFRSAMRGIVPDEILDRKDKVGFHTPDKEWFMTNTAVFRKIIQQSHDIPLFNTPRLLQEFDLIMAGKKRYSWQVWRWVNFIRWYQLTFA